MCRFQHYLAAAVLKAFRFFSFCVNSISALIPDCNKNALYELYVLNVYTRAIPNLAHRLYKNRMCNIYMHRVTQLPTTLHSKPCSN